MAVVKAVKSFFPDPSHAQNKNVTFCSFELLFVINSGDHIVRDLETLNVSVLLLGTAEHVESCLCKIAALPFSPLLTVRSFLLPQPLNVS